MKKNYQGMGQENRRRILESVNPGETMMNEATNEINPITGKSYEGIWYDNKWFHNKSAKEGPPLGYFITQHPSIMCQLRLAKMDKDIGRLEHKKFEKFIDALSDLALLYGNPRMTLSSIRDAYGLDIALRAVEIMNEPIENLIGNTPLKKLKHFYDISQIEGIIQEKIK